MRDTGRILNIYPGYPEVTELDGKAYIDGKVVLNNLTIAGWKYIAEQVIPRKKIIIAQAAGMMPVFGEVFDKFSGDIAEYHPDRLPDRAAKIAWMKEKRREFLRSCDWGIASDSPLTSAQKTTVNTYRAALRNMGTTVTNAQLDAATTKAALLALFPSRPAIIDSSM